MSRRARFAAFLGIPIIVIIAVVLGTRDHSSEATAAQPSRLATAALPAVREVFTGKASYARSTVATSTIARVESRIDKCDGPVAVPLVSKILIAEHDYCGGAEWIGRLKVGQAVVLSGPGVTPGTYVADVLSYQLRGKALVSDLPDSDVVLQTCVSKTKLVLVGMRRVDTLQAS